jgi:hypothetical protein
VNPSDWDEEYAPVCDVCNGESGGRYAGLACSSLGSVSFAYCGRCLEANAEPVGMLRAVREDAGYPQNLAAWVHDLTTWWDGAYISLAALPPLTPADGG